MLVPSTVLVVAAHPDDAEFGCGGIVRKWIEQGTRAFYLIATNGDKGDDEGLHTPAQLASIRASEQQAAAAILGVEAVTILDRSDGSLVYCPELRGEMVRCIRLWKPEVLLTHDPEVIVQAHGGINHSDHRVTGATAIDAAYPFARGKLQYAEQIKAGLEPHKVKQIYIWGSNQPTHFEDVTDQAELKIEALLAHRSQIAHPDGMRQFTLEHMQRHADRHNFKYAEAFRVVDLH